MAALFAVFSLAMLAAIVNLRKVAMTLVFIGLGLSIVIFLHHATDVLKINL